jgi:hypothetical protein
MPYFIFNDSTGKQRADFYSSQISETILWQGESLEAFEAETGFTIAQLGGFKLSKGKLTYSQALKDAHDAPPPPPPLSLDSKRIILMEQFKGLPELTRRAFKQTALDVEGFLRLEDVTNAIFFLEEAKTVPNADTVLLQNMINFLES